MEQQEMLCCRGHEGIYRETGEAPPIERYFQSLQIRLPQHRDASGCFVAMQQSILYFL